MCSLEQFEPSPPPTPATPSALGAYSARREYYADIILRSNLLYEEVVFAYIHIEVIESACLEIEALLKAQGIA